MAFALNPHGFVLLASPRDGHATPQPSAAGAAGRDAPRQIIYANHAYRRLMEPQPARAEDAGAAAEVVADRLPWWLVADEGVPDPGQPGPGDADAWSGFDEQRNRWLHVYMFPVRPKSDVAGRAFDPSVFGAFVTDPAELTTGRRSRPAAFGDLTIDYAARAVSIGGRPVELTRTEYELLALLSRSPNVALGSQEVLSALWETQWIGDSSALDVHVSRLRRKLGESGAAPRYIHTVRGHGLKFVSQPDGRAGSTPWGTPRAPR